MGSTVGAGCAYLFGGWIVTLVSHSTTFVLPLIGEVRPWQATFFIVGVPGALFSLLIFAVPEPVRRGMGTRSEEHTSELQSLMRISYAVFCLKKKIDSRGIQYRSDERKSR